MKTLNYSNLLTFLLLIANFVIMASPYAVAGAKDGGGTITICDQPIDSIEWTTKMSDLPGYKDYRKVIDLLSNSVPLLAHELSTIESKLWQYADCDPGRISDPSFQFNTDKTIAYFGEFLIIFKPKFIKNRDKGGSLFHEAVRDLCAKYIDAQDSNQNTCTITNKILIYNQFSKGQLTTKELLTKLYGIYGRGYNTKDRLNSILSYFQTFINERLPGILHESSQKYCLDDINTQGPMLSTISDEINMSLNLSNTSKMKDMISALFSYIGISGDPFIDLKINYGASGSINYDCAKIKSVQYENLKKDFNSMTVLDLALRFGGPF